ncbi:MAG: hypothetical protein ACRDJO_08540 [Actinomycetota bacterium]
MSPFTEGLPGRIEVRPGASARYPLKSGMGGGYTWSVTEPPDPGVAEAAVEVGPPPPQPATGAPTSTVARETLVVLGVSPGSTGVRLVLARSWDPHTPLADVRIDILVS